ncbi:hypothetical protein A3C89_02450 [Candidatus Kaiserbacteria bacterium RIFCSPHIGHO2_02_FULL_50_50]|uniref:Uncharacterized protein n=1 Tax=Candidatus Kaiserbacteria bacterium RIFCSPHIGHO2_02_FULL_50_50 TaxID=1798492 RepID=A0A1F6DD43_9BACT|nr:MAG: hypothetical protein A3C89_02450 [Candidatus Kaiserbacteria bacterium RIFCSPHIGHO2_02_FULL_50_50]OGG88194.1 MAG: hypothetical protein A3G62_00355 [Candidatus Kaiserbacteria bacterium RIFCSPLOWO2_12_FULL_50_10]
MATKKVAASKEKGLSKGEKVGLGVALTAAAVGAIGAYFLAGSKDAAKNRKMVKSWMLKAKAEVLEGLEQAKKMSSEEYAQLLDQVSAVYASAQNVSKKDIAEFKDEMSQHWKKLERTGKKAVKKVIAPKE